MKYLIEGFGCMGPVIIFMPFPLIKLIFSSNDSTLKPNVTRLPASNSFNFSLHMSSTFVSPSPKNDISIPGPAGSLSTNLIPTISS
jgi:hypothetical protein